MIAGGDRDRRLTLCPGNLGHLAYAQGRPDLRGGVTLGFSKGRFAYFSKRTINSWGRRVEESKRPQGIPWGRDRVRRPARLVPWEGVTSSRPSQSEPNVESTPIPAA